MQTYYAIGIMSGTSLDGLDIAYCKINTEKPELSEIICAKTYVYPDEITTLLTKATDISAIEFCELNYNLANYIALQTKNFKSEFDLSNVNFIASHGHTVFHQPQKGFTTQIGCGATIAAITEIPTICDFRSGNVAHGGTGAPLVPIGDRDLFKQYDACLNLGGIANISFSRLTPLISYDITFANMAGNYLMNKLGKAYDDGGYLAKSGTLNTDLLTKMNDLNYFRQTHPKSLGIEYFNEHFRPILDTKKCELPDVLATLSIHLAQHIGKSLKHFGIKNLLITGGGAYNNHWIEMIKKEAACTVTLPSDQLIQFKEAFIFAYLGALRLENRENSLKSVTGSRKDHCGGAIYLP